MITRTGNLHTPQLRNVQAPVTPPTTAPVSQPQTAEQPRITDAMDRSVRAEHKMEIVCPVLAAMVKEGRLKMDADGNIQLKQLKNVVVQQMGVSPTMAAALLGVGFFGNKPSDILRNIMGMQMNVKELRSGMIKHPADSAILTQGKFDQQKFDALVSHARNGRMTVEGFGHAIRSQAARDAHADTKVQDVIPTSLGGILPDGMDSYARGVPSALVEFSALVNIFGTKDPVTGERYIEVETMRKLYQDKALPPDVRMQSREATGMIDATATMSKMAWHMAFGSAAGTAQTGVAKAMGTNPKDADAVMGAGKATCPFMNGGTSMQKPATENELANLHAVRNN
ncbi:MAG: hypothetical protein AB2A00_40995 [Myxococcota bacterium]